MHRISLRSNIAKEISYQQPLEGEKGCNPSRRVKFSIEGWKGTQRMTRRESVRFYIDAISRTFQEYCDSRRYNEALARRKELMLYVRQLEAHIEYLDSEIRDQYKRQTGVRAVRGLWKKLGTKATGEDPSRERSSGEASESP